MPVSRVDSRKRVIVAPARPGDVFDVRAEGEDRIVLVRLAAPLPAPRMSRARCLRAIASSPLKMKTTWEALKAETREA
jgi:hypothetical protein